MKSNAYVLTQGEFGFETKGDFEDYKLLREYLIDNTRTNENEKRFNKKNILGHFYNNVAHWENEIKINIQNVSRSGYHIYMIEMVCHRHGKDGYVVSLAYVHKSDIKNYLARRNKHEQNRSN